MKNQFLASGSIIIIICFDEPHSLDYVEILTTLCWIMLDPLDYAWFIELVWLLGPIKAFTFGKIGPCYNLVIMCS
jgi:hypothetical protein